MELAVLVPVALSDVDSVLEKEVVFVSLWLDVAELVIVEVTLDNSVVETELLALELTVEVWVELGELLSQSDR